MLCVLSVSAYADGMAGAIAEHAGQRIRAAIEEVLRDSPDVPATARAAFGRLVDVLETNADAVIFAADATLSTQQAAEVLGVSRMTVVRLVDRGALVAESAGVHRRISVSELARYQAESGRARRSVLAALGSDIDEDTPPDEVIATR